MTSHTNFHKNWTLLFAVLSQAPLQMSNLGGATDYCVHSSRCGTWDPGSLLSRIAGPWMEDLKIA